MLSCYQQSNQETEHHEHPEVSLLPLLVTPQRGLLFTLLSSEINFAHFWAFYKWNCGHVLFCLLLNIMCVGVIHVTRVPVVLSHRYIAAYSLNMPQWIYPLCYWYTTGLFPLWRGVSKHAAALNTLLHVLGQTYALLSHGYVIRSAVLTTAICNYVLDKMYFFLNFLKCKN